MSSENFLLLVRLGFSLSLVFGLMWVAARVVRGRAGALHRAKVDHLEVIERKPLTKNSSIAIVRVAGETLTVGITDTNVTLLGQVDLPEEPDDATTLESVASVAPVVSLAAAPSRAAAARATGPLVTAGDPSGRRSFIDVLRDRTVRHVPR